MKLIFKSVILYLCVSSFSTAHARDIILVENLASNTEGKLLLKIIQEKFKIPRKLITYRRVNKECSKESEAIMQLCLKVNGDLEVVNVNRFAVENSLRVFLETEE